MNRLFTTAAAVSLLMAAAACGSNYGSSSPTAPSNPTTTPTNAGAVTIDIVGERGALSFSPNPAAVPAGQMVVWHNTDAETHHVVLNHGGLDTGNIPAGGFTAPMLLAGSDGYHCTIHPSMTGSVNGGRDGAAIDPSAAPPADPATGPSAY